jgi:hypothetical protein
MTALAETGATYIGREIASFPSSIKKNNHPNQRTCLIQLIIICKALLELV